MSNPIHVIFDRLSNNSNLVNQIILETELEFEIPQGDDQIYCGDDDNGNPIFAPIENFDNEGNRTIDPITYDNNEPIW